MSELDAAYWALESERGDPARWLEAGRTLLRHASTSSVTDPLESAAARFALLAALELEPGTDTSFVLGALLASCGELEAASRAYARAAALPPLRIEPCERAAALMAQLNRAQDAERWALEGLARAQRQGAPPAMLTSLANSLLRAGRGADAIAVLERIVAERPDDPQAVCNLAVALRRTGELSRSLDLAHRSIGLAPELPAPYLALGRSLEAAQRYDEAVGAYREAIARAPSGPAAREAALYLKRIAAGPASQERDSGIDGAFTGDLMVLAVPELLELLRMQSGTGELRVWTDAKEVRIVLAVGKIVGARAPNGRRIAVRDEGDTSALGSLVEIVRDLVSWRAGRFEFTRTTARGDGDGSPSGIDSQFLLMEVMRTEDESTRF